MGGAPHRHHAGAGLAVRRSARPRLPAAAARRRRRPRLHALRRRLEGLPLLARQRPGDDDRGPVLAGPGRARRPRLRPGHGTVRRRRGDPRTVAARGDRPVADPQPRLPEPDRAGLPAGARGVVRGVPPGRAVPRVQRAARGRADDDGPPGRAAGHPRGRAELRHLAAAAVRRPAHRRTGQRHAVVLLQRVGHGDGVGVLVRVHPAAAGRGRPQGEPRTPDPVAARPAVCAANAGPVPPAVLHRHRRHRGRAGLPRPAGADAGDPQPDRQHPPLGAPGRHREGAQLAAAEPAVGPAGAAARRRDDPRRAGPAAVRRGLADADLARPPERRQRRGDPGALGRGRVPAGDRRAARPGVRQRVLARRAAAGVAAGPVDRAAAVAGAGAAGFARQLQVPARAADRLPARHRRRAARAVPVHPRRAGHAGAGADRVRRRVGRAGRRQPRPRRHAGRHRGPAADRGPHRGRGARPGAGRHRPAAGGLRRPRGGAADRGRPRPRAGRVRPRPAAVRRHRGRTEAHPRRARLAGLAAGRGRYAGRAGRRTGRPAGGRGARPAGGRAAAHGARRDQRCPHRTAADDAGPERDPDRLGQRLRHRRAGRPGDRGGGRDRPEQPAGPDEPAGPGDRRLAGGRDQQEPAQGGAVDHRPGRCADRSGQRAARLQPRAVGLPGRRAVRHAAGQAGRAQRLPGQPNHLPAGPPRLHRVRGQRQAAGPQFLAAAGGAPPEPADGQAAGPHRGAAARRGGRGGEPSGRAGRRRLQRAAGPEPDAGVLGHSSRPERADRHLHRLRTQPPAAVPRHGRDGDRPGRRVERPVLPQADRDRPGRRR